MTPKLTSVHPGLWVCEGGYCVRRVEIDAGYSRYSVTGPNIPLRRSFNGNDIRTLAEARRIIADAKASGGN